MLLAKDIMTPEVISVQPDVTVTDLAKLFTENNISGAPVLSKNGQLLGIVTQSDLIDQNKKLHIPTVITILDSVFYLENPDKMEDEIKKIAGTTVKDIFTKKLTTISPETPLDEIATIMAEKGMHSLPVIQEGKIVGIVGRRDILSTLYS